MARSGPGNSSLCFAINVKRVPPLESSATQINSQELSVPDSSFTRELSNCSPSSSGYAQFAPFGPVKQCNNNVLSLPLYLSLSCSIGGF